RDRAVQVRRGDGHDLFALSVCSGARDGTVVTEVERILALPRRPPVNCERMPGTRLYVPETQALVEYVTAQYSRGPRKCACEQIGHPCITTLRAEQAWTLREAAQVNGAHGLVAV